MPVIVAIVTLGAIGVSCVAPARQRARIVALGVTTLSLVAFVAALRVSRIGVPLNVSTTNLLPFSGVRLHLDPLGALFIMVTSVVAVAVAIYLVGYARHHALTRSVSTTLILFVSSMLLLPMAWNVTSFLALWELMALTSLVLILSEHQRGEAVRRAGLWYAVLTQVGAAVITLGLVVIAAHAGQQDFGAMARASGSWSAGTRGVIFLLLFVGFASKAGAVPLHVWLPRAHAEAPSPVSALMSAAMVNMGLYGILRVGRTMLGGGVAWWWIVVIVVGAGSAIYGAVHAATSTDLKRLLAYSTTDNVGLILIAIGVSGLLAVQGHGRLAALALFAGLFHMVTHSVFKGTLFLSAGSIQFSTGTRDLDALGGLLTRMPVAGTIFAVGGAALAALPPFGGFVSEWLLLQSLLRGLGPGTTTVLVLMPLGVAALALTGGLTAAAFVKAFGVGFLGTPRTEAAAQVVEPPALMNVGAMVLGFLCLVLGIAPLVVFSQVGAAVSTTVGHAASAVAWRGASLVVTSSRGTFSPSVIAGVLVVAAFLTLGVRSWLSRAYRVRRTAVWACGRTSQSARMTYTATSFAEPLQRVFDDVIQPQRDVDVSHQSESQYYVAAVSFRTEDRDVFEHYGFLPIFRSVYWVSARVRRLQNGSVHRYLGYGLGALIVVLLVTR